MIFNRIQKTTCNGKTCTILFNSKILHLSQPSFYIIIQLNLAPLSNNSRIIVNGALNDKLEEQYNFMYSNSVPAY